MRSGIRTGSRFIRALIILLIIACCLSASKPPAGQASMTADVRAALDHVSADSLRGHLSFIASDALEGRNTPSRGLDIAAEYIAAQFRRAGLEPAGDDGYFQTANWVLAEQDMRDFYLRIRRGGRTTSVAKTEVSFSLDKAVSLSGTPLVKVDYKDAAAIAALKPEQVAGKAILTEMPDIRREDRSRRAEMFRAQNQFMARAGALKAALVVSIDRRAGMGTGAGQGTLIDPENRRPSGQSPDVPLITVHDAGVAKLFDAMGAGATSADISLRVPAVIERPIKVRNCIGILRGSDPALKDSYVLVTAHYDHLGVRPGTGGDNIFNGANDDGSGTVSVIELAAALATLKERPKRSIVFMTFFGEEKGLLGSRYYGRHPVFPIGKTVADVNLEQVGRTDSSEGPQLSNASMTGFDYSDVGKVFKAAGEMTGVEVYKHEQNSDPFFGRSDNQALADRGVPAHTLCTAFVYPDYHGAGDHWDKIDYQNMAKVNRMVALGLIMIANNAEEPRWNESNPKAARYVKAWRERHAKAGAGEHR
ncbi:MAG TPA: M28 family peptidase [Blastocatellia bacterium]|nr:M28 family peptidase [Blastocatellia bacterium]